MCGLSYCDTHISDFRSQRQAFGLVMNFVPEITGLAVKKQQHGPNRARFWVSLLVGLAFVGVGAYEFHRDGSSIGTWAAFFFAIVAFMAAGAYYRRIINPTRNP